MSLSSRSLVRQHPLCLSADLVLLLGHNDALVLCYPPGMDAIVSLTASVSEDPLHALAAPPPGSSLVEIRADLLADLDLAQAVRRCPIPVLITYRSESEGGRGSNDPETRRRVLTGAWESGAQLLDLELNRDLRLMDELGIEPERVMLSWHDSEGTPADLVSVVRTMLETRARWVKVVPFARTLADLTRIVSLQKRFARRNRLESRLIAFAMGPVGLPSRYLSPLLGAPLTFVAWNDAAAAAPGQVTFEALDAAIGHLSGPPQRLFGVIGRDVSASLSPRLHGAAYRSCGLPYAMLPFSIPSATEARRLFQPGAGGIFDGAAPTLHALAVTAPYKELALQHATIAAPRARRAGAANTLILKQGQILADTTDADGITGSLLGAGIDPRGVTVIVQGTGGAARGAAVGLDLAGARVFLRGRDAARTSAVARQLGIAACAPGDVPDDATIFVNATPLGTRAGDPSPFTARELSGAAVIIDMVYGRKPPKLAELAAEASVTYIEGRAVLLFQGVPQFAAMTTHTPPIEAMRAALFPAKGDDLTP